MTSDDCKKELRAINTTDMGHVVFKLHGRLCSDSERPTGFYFIHDGREIDYGAGDPDQAPLTRRRRLWLTGTSRASAQIAHQSPRRTDASRTSAGRATLAHRAAVHECQSASAIYLAHPPGPAHRVRRSDEGRRSHARVARAHPRVSQHGLALALWRACARDQLGVLDLTASVLTLTSYKH